MQKGACDLSAVKVGAAGVCTEWEVECKRVCTGAVEGGRVSLHCFLVSAQPPPGDHSDDEIGIVPAIHPCPDFVYPPGKKRRRACGVEGCSSQAKGKVRTASDDWGPPGGRCTYHGADRRKCSVHGCEHLGRRVCGPDGFGERGARCHTRGARNSASGSGGRARPSRTPDVGGGWEIHLSPPQLSAPTTVIRAKAASYEQVEETHWVVRVSILGKGGMLSYKAGRGAPVKHPRRRRWFCSADGCSSKAQKKDPLDGLPKCYEHGATRTLCSVDACPNQARGSPAKVDDALGPAGARCPAHSPGIVDLTEANVRTINFAGGR